MFDNFKFIRSLTYRTAYYYYCAARCMRPHVLTLACQGSRPGAVTVTGASFVAIAAPPPSVVAPSSMDIFRRRSEQHG